MICEICKNKIKDNENWLKIPELNIEVEIEVHDKNKSWNDLNLGEKEDNLLSAEECIFLANSKYTSILKMDGSSSTDDFFIKQPFNLNLKNGYVAGFSVDSDGADFDCYWYPADEIASIGVRFKRMFK